MPVNVDPDDEVGEGRETVVAGRARGEGREGISSPLRLASSILSMSMPELLAGWRSEVEDVRVRR